jgi:hypothetical protein
LGFDEQGRVQFEIHPEELARYETSRDSEASGPPEAPSGTDGSSAVQERPVTRYVAVAVRSCRWRARLRAVRRAAEPPCA